MPVTTRKMARERDRGAGNDDQNDAASTRRVPGSGSGTTRKRQRTVNPSNEREQLQNRSPPSVPLPILPDEIIGEILSWLPVKNLLQLRCVCKSWKSLVSDPQFVKNHLHKSSRNTKFTHHHFVSVHKNIHNKLDLLSSSVETIFSNPSMASVSASYGLRGHYYIVGSCNGLVCLSSIRQNKVLLWNPSTRWISPKSPSMADNSQKKHCYTLFGFGFDNLSDKYKVLAVFCDPKAENLPKTVVKVYGFGDNSWREIQSFPYFPIKFHKLGKFVSGTLNWVTTRTDSGYDSPLGDVCVDQLVIVSFDLGKETYGQVLLPRVDDKCMLLLGLPMLAVLRDSLCFFHDDNKTHLVVWLMKEFGVQESWTKLVTIPYLDLENVGRPFHCWNPLFMSENGQVLLRDMHNRGILLLYNARENKFEHPLQINKNWTRPRFHVGSLVSLPYC